MIPAAICSQWSNGRLSGVGSAVFSECTEYRYRLDRVWSKGPKLVFVGLNPSTATESTDDPTIAKLIGFASRWGLGGFVMLNLFAFRSTNPEGLPANTLTACGPLNLEVLGEEFEAAHGHGDVLAFGWGRHAHKTPERQQWARNVIALARKFFGTPQAFAFNQDGTPRHPLYLPNTSTLAAIP